MTIKTQLEQQTIEELRALGVGLLYLFGSVAEGTYHGLSDIDIGIVLEDPKPLDENSFELYNRLYDILTDAFHQGDVDIIFLQAAGLEVCCDAIRHGHLLFAASSQARYEFEERVTILYADFKQLLDEFNKAVLERI
jgi:predicted nucleotidyltransferase